MLPKFFCAIQGVKDDFLLISHSLTISSTLYMVLQHITKRVGDFLSNKVERYCIVMQFLHHKPLLKEQEK